MCVSLSGAETHIDGSFMHVGQHLNDENGNDFTDSFVDMQTADAHPNCHCHLRFELRAY